MSALVQMILAVLTAFGLVRGPDATGSPAWTPAAATNAARTPAPLAAPTPAPAPAPAPAASPQAEAFARAADYSAKFSGRAVLVRHRGVTLFERYDRGWTADRPHPLASGTKSFTGVMAMLAVQDGLLTLDERAADTLTDWKADPRKSKITIRQLLTLSSGLEPSDALLGGRGGSGTLGEGARQRAERLGRAGTPRVDDHFAAALTVPARHEPGEKFEYGPSHFYAFGALLEAKLARSDRPEKDVSTYLRQRVLGSLGIRAARIGRDRAGHPNLPGGMLLTAREWAKLGQFVLDDGRVRQDDGGLTDLLRPELLAECFKPSDANPAYGLTWWLPGRAAAAGGESDPSQADTGRSADPRRDAARLDRVGAIAGPEGERLDVYMAAGLGKQRLYVLPAYDLVVVRFAEATREGNAFRDAEFLTPIVEAVAAKR